MRSGYVRLERASTVVLVDAGPPPPMELAGAACAGCLSFELSSGGELVLVNGGVPGEIEASRRTVARATSSHNTLCLGEQSSAKLVRDARLEREIGGPPLRHPDPSRAPCARPMAASSSRPPTTAMSRAGASCTRGTLKLDAAGSRLEGSDRLGARQRPAALFLGRAVCRSTSICIRMPRRASGPRRRPRIWCSQNGEQWRLTATGAAVSIEEGLYFADAAGACPAQQVVLRARCYGASEVSWVIERTRAADPAGARAAERRRASSSGWRRRAPASRTRTRGPRRRDRLRRERSPDRAAHLFRRKSVLSGSLVWSKTHVP